MAAGAHRSESAATIAGGNPPPAWLGPDAVLGALIMARFPKEIIPALVIIFALYALAGTADYQSQHEIARASK